MGFNSGLKGLNAVHRVRIFDRQKRPVKCVLLSEVHCAHLESFVECNGYGAAEESL